MNYKELETARYLNQIIHLDIYLGLNFFGVDFVISQTSLTHGCSRETLLDTRGQNKFFKSLSSLLKFLQWFDSLPLHPEFMNKDKLEHPFRFRFRTCS